MSSPAQLRALFDILTQYESYTEIVALKYPSNIDTFGYPLQSNDLEFTSSLPLLNGLIQRFVLDLPGLRDVDQKFWTGNVVDLVVALTKSNLSESFDRQEDDSVISIRKTIATFIASLVEEVTRGVLGGFSSPDATSPEQHFDVHSPTDLEAAWNELMRRCLYEDMVEKLVDKVSETPRLADHASVVQAGHKYAVLMISAALQYFLTEAPQGKNLLGLIKSVHDMIPYYLIRQTLKIGNVASMINGMVKIVLAKMNISSLTSWFGAAESDAGMNLLQQIISTVLGWDISSYQRQCLTIERDQIDISKPQIDVIKAYTRKPADEQDDVRRRSVDEKQFLVQTILLDAKLTRLPDDHLQAGAKFLSLSLAISDREKLIDVLCRSRPDLLTGTVRALVTAYEPVIRALHKSVDLSGSLADLQTFLIELMALSGQGKVLQNEQMPTVEQYYHLLDKHAPKFHKFLHEACKNSAELRTWYQKYAIEALKSYRRTETPSDEKDAAGDFSNVMKSLMDGLSAVEKDKVEKELDKHQQDLEALITLSSRRFETLVRNLEEGRSDTRFGPGIYLAKWHELMRKSPQATSDKDEGIPERPHDRAADFSQPPPCFDSCPTIIKCLVPKIRHSMSESKLLERPSAINVPN